ncbi:hypothetical protein ACJIZ3_002634 [Penstemon smallii]|uniref:Uncharacterized protein n=1 Tax=Penstemon smallii TaxID=265156 RepID=A0ABD3U8H1_9LAMI
MRDEEAQRPQTSPNTNNSTSNLISSAPSVKKDASFLEGLFGRGKYKLWALAAIILLALWSMFTGSVTLKWSSVNLKHSSLDLDSSIHGDLDILYIFSGFWLVVLFHWNTRHQEQLKGKVIIFYTIIKDVDEREKMVRQMWNEYKHSSISRLPSFWRDAFGAAYQDLTNEVPSVRNSALLEIAKMSFRSSDIVHEPQSNARESEEMQLGKSRRKQQ